MHGGKGVRGKGIPKCKSKLPLAHNGTEKKGVNFEDLPNKNMPKVTIISRTANSICHLLSLFYNYFRSFNLKLYTIFIHFML